MNYCLFGKKGSGKTEVAKILEKRLNLKRIFFAKKLKELIFNCSGLDDSFKEKKGSYQRNVDIYTLNKDLKKYGYSVLTQEENDHIRAIEYYPNVGDVYRNLLQYIGTNIYKSRNDFHWVNFFKNDAIAANNGFVCDDCRFVVEKNYIKNNFKVKMIKVYSDDDNDDDTHESETEQKDFPYDYLIYNSKDGLDKLEKTVVELIF